jgi:hypothetical protein
VIGLHPLVLAGNPTSQGRLISWQVDEAVRNWTVKFLGHHVVQRPITYGSQAATPDAVATSRCSFGSSQNNHLRP